MLIWRSKIIGSSPVTVSNMMAVGSSPVTVINIMTIGSNPVAVIIKKGTTFWNHYRMDNQEFKLYLAHNKKYKPIQDITPGEYNCFC